MAANIDPIYSRLADIQVNGLYVVGAFTAADLSTAVVGTSVYLIFTADATNGGYLQKLKFRSAPGGTTSATVARIWINNGASPGTATNSNLYDEITLPATANSATLATAGQELLLNLPMPAGYRIYLTIHTASATGWMVTP